MAAHAEQSRFIRIQQRTVATYQLEARYQNYLFTFAARVTENGHFQTEEALAVRLQALDSHIHEKLEIACSAVRNERSDGPLN
jgi:hypothetical protein